MSYVDNESILRQGVIVFLLFLFAGCLEVRAQDIIITREGERIEAEIIKISDNGIQYRKWGDMNGEIVVLPADQLHIVLYQNGSFKMFDCVKTAPISELPIIRCDDWYYRGKQRMSEARYLDYIRQHCAEAWADYQKGKRLWTAGWIMAGTSSLCLALGCISGIHSETAGLVLIGIGAGMVVTSIPCLVIGGKKKYRSYETYNRRCNRQPMASVNPDIKFSVNGLGLAINF